MGNFEKENSPGITDEELLAEHFQQPVCGVCVLHGIQQSVGLAVL